MIVYNDGINHNSGRLRSVQQQITISVPAEIANSIYQQTLILQKQDIVAPGFLKGAAPLDYVEKAFGPNIITHVLEILFWHYAIPMLCNNLRARKLACPLDPKLQSSNFEPGQDATFDFTFETVPFEYTDKWKYINLDMPARKFYKDIDKQVESFLKEEHSGLLKATKEVVPGDWVYLEISFVDNDHNILEGGHKSCIWVKLTDEEVDLDLKNLLETKAVGDKFISKNKFLQKYVNNQLSIEHKFLVEIKNKVHATGIQLDYFKKFFSIRSNKDTNLKLIEVFSFRNDISQRREIIDTVLKTVSKQFFIPVPQHMLAIQQNLVLSEVIENPDYHVYKSQNDFKEKIRMLAEKQLKEAILVETIAYNENIQVTHDDEVGYLNLYKRPRTKQFIYFDLPSNRSSVQEIPVPSEVLKRWCLREKTLNYMIKKLTRE